MEHRVEHSIERVIEAMQENLGEPITIDDMARIAMFSKFHFSRIFRDSIGVSPGRFLSALRLQEAKRLLNTTSLSIAEISNRVGYSSVGTFSSRFKTSVGVAPSVFRATGGIIPGRSAGRARRRAQDKRGATVRGKILASAGTPAAPAFVGLFPDVIPQGIPICCATLPGPGPYVLENAPQGTWHVLACSFSNGLEEGAGGVSERVHGPTVGTSGPITIRPGTVLDSVDVQLRPIGPFDPPVLLAPGVSQSFTSTAC